MDKIEKSLNKYYEEIMNDDIIPKWEPISVNIPDEKYINCSDIYFYYSQNISKLVQENKGNHEKVKLIFDKYQEAVSQLYLKSLECELLRTELKNYQNKKF
jgi:hypothetical protein